MSDLPVHPRHLPYSAKLEPRHPETVRLVVIHCTELPDLAAAREYGERILYPASGTGNSGHYYIDRDGRVEEWVPPDRIAHHVRGHNDNSIGIELVNRGRFPDWLNSQSQEMSEPYPPEQIAALVALLHHLIRHLDRLDWIAGHEQLDTERVSSTDDSAIRVARKLDPGPLFPWQSVLASVPLQQPASNEAPG